MLSRQSRPNALKSCYAHHMKFDYESIPEGYYDLVHDRGFGIQSFWHRNKFESVQHELDCLDVTTHLDVACGPGTFVGMYSNVPNKIAIDLASTQIEYAKGRYGGDESINFLNKSTSEIQGKTDGDTMIEFIEHITYEELKVIFLDLEKVSNPFH